MTTSKRNSVKKWEWKEDKLWSWKIWLSLSLSVRRLKNGQMSHTWEKLCCLHLWKIRSLEDNLLKFMLDKRFIRLLKLNKLEITGIKNTLCKMEKHMVFNCFLNFSKMVLLSQNGLTCQQFRIVLFNSLNMMQSKTISTDKNFHFWTKKWLTTEKKQSKKPKTTITETVKPISSSNVISKEL